MQERTRHIPDLGLVHHATAQHAAAGRPVAIVVARVKVGHVLELLLERQLVEALAQRKLPVDGVLGDAKVGHVKEALGADGLDEDLRQLGVALFGAVFGEINIGDLILFLS